MVDDSLSDEDKALFREHMRSVTPLKNEKNPKAPEAAAAVSKAVIPKRPKILKPKAAETSATYFLSDFITEPILSQTTLSYYRPELPPDRWRALKNGRIPWEARLDLHGLTSEAAREALCHFIQSQSQASKRCLLIIHGKGGQQGAAPVIKNLVNRWLPQFEEVLAFHSTQPKDGGHGAVYVLLKRKRKDSED